MTDNNILEELEKKSEELLVSNAEFAEKLRKNQEKLVELKEEILNIRSGTAVFPELTDNFEKFRSDLESKNSLVKELISDLKPLEVDLAQKDKMLEDINEKIKAQAEQIEMLSKKLLDTKADFEKVNANNNDLKKAVAEKESLLKVMRDKLNEKTTQLNDSLKKNKEFEESMALKKKEEFAVVNKIGALEKHVVSTDDQNQKLLYELMKQNERIKELEDELSNKRKLFDSKIAEFEKSLDALEKKNEEEKGFLIKRYSKKLAIMDATIAALKSRISEQEAVVGSKLRKEQDLIKEFNARMQDLISTKPGADYLNSQKIEEISSMIEMALDNGSEIEDIKNSLLSTGYSENEIEKAFSLLNIC
jgi:chromosome segregation ATPase